MGAALLWTAPLLLLCISPLVRASVIPAPEDTPVSAARSTNYSRKLFKDVLWVSCGASKCAPGAKCSRSAAGVSVCSCLPGYIGDPLHNCVRVECQETRDCPQHQACSNNKCLDLCLGACGLNATCNFRNHIAVCSCPPGFEGDPFESCQKPESKSICSPYPCGVFTKCHVEKGNPVCRCLDGYTGDPYVGCHQACASSADCDYAYSCRDARCTPVCDRCSVTAECTTTAAHEATCTCPAGFVGDPVDFCRPECEANADCPRSKPLCFGNKCTDPCAGVCGVNAECTLHGDNYYPTCLCPADTNGNPFIYCRPSLKKEVCEPNPCGLNAKCSVGRDATGAEKPDCTCPQGYIGDPFSRCQKGECMTDLQCGDARACVLNYCVDPCEHRAAEKPACGVGASCKARHHLAVCTCPPGTYGDALEICSKLDSQLSIFPYAYSYSLPSFNSVRTFK